VRTAHDLVHASTVRTAHGVILAPTVRIAHATANPASFPLAPEAA
jgi:hypothetical protein